MNSKHQQVRSFYPCRGHFSCDITWQRAFTSFLMLNLNHQDVGLHSGLVGQSKWFPYRPTEQAISTIFLIGGFAFMPFDHSIQSMLVTYRFKIFIGTSSALSWYIQGSCYSRELSLLTYSSVWQFTSKAWPAQFSHYPQGITSPAGMSTRVNSTLASASGFCLGRVHWTLLDQWDEPSAVCS